jgi:hypothetical protein
VTDRHARLMAAYDFAERREAERGRKLR